MFRFITNRRTLYFTGRPVKKQTPRWFQVELRVNVTVHERKQNRFLYNTNLLLQTSDAREILRARHLSRSNWPRIFYFAYPTNIFSFNYFVYNCFLNHRPMKYSSTTRIVDRTCASCIAGYFTGIFLRRLTIDSSGFTM